MGETKHPEIDRSTAIAVDPPSLTASAAMPWAWPAERRRARFRETIRMLTVENRLRAGDQA